MRKKITRWVAVLMATVFLSTVSVTSASALQITNRQVYVSPIVTTYKCYYNYNFFEEQLLGKRDGWRYTAAACR